MKVWCVYSCNMIISKREVSAKSLNLFDSLLLCDNRVHSICVYIGMSNVSLLAKSALGLSKGGILPPKRRALGTLKLTSML